MSCQTVGWVCRWVVVFSCPSPLAYLTVSEQAFGLLVHGGGQGLQLFALRLGQVICSFISWNPQWALIRCRTTVHSCGRSCRSFGNWWIGWSGVLEAREWRAALESVRTTVFCAFISALKFEHVLPVAFMRLTFLLGSWQTRHSLPPFLTASSAEPSMNTCVQSAYGYFFSSISRVGAICCVGICCSAGSRPGTSTDMVALRSSWFQSLLQGTFSSLICGSGMFPCAFLRSLANWLRLCFFNLFWAWAASLWSGWPSSLRIFSVRVRILNVLRSSRGFRSAFFSIFLTGVVSIAPTKTRSATFWTLSSLLLLAFRRTAPV